MGKSVLIKNKVDERIPATRQERKHLEEQIARFVEAKHCKPPMSLDELDALTIEFMNIHALDPHRHDWVMVFVNNSLWRNTIASIPYKRRILLLPQCLKASSVCEAECDEFGLLCKHCNTCSIGRLEDEAENLGMMTLVAEGFTAVAGLIESGQIEAVIGVACLDSLEKAFPLLVNHAIPGIAIPLTVAGCKDTQLDVQVVSLAAALRNPNTAAPIDLDRIKSEVKEWFAHASITSLLGESRYPSERTAREWLSGEGKRWRPYLQAAVYMALIGEGSLPLKVKQSAVAIECFHKASLIHDDIEDRDDYRYGEETLHKRLGVPAAINIGDLLLGEGYRLLTHVETNDSEKAELIRVAAKAHCALCAGQGMELDWMLTPTELTMDTVTEIFRLKTAPAFEAAIDFGAICANAPESLRATLRSYCDALGIAYQLKDDLDDYAGSESFLLHPSAVIAAACEMASERTLIEQLKQEPDIRAFFGRAENGELEEKAIARTRQLYEHYRHCAIRSLRDVDNTDLKRFLFRITGKMLNLNYS